MQLESKFTSDAVDGTAIVCEWDDFKRKWVRTVINLKASVTDEAIKKALIQLGWTPPKERNMSQQKQYPSINEATHVLEGRHYKVGEYTSYLWVGDHWEFAACSPEQVREHGTPLKTQQEAQQRTQDQPATTLQTPLSNSPSLPVQEVSKGICNNYENTLLKDDFAGRVTVGYGLTDKDLAERTPLCPSMTEKNGNATCDPTSPDNRQVGGDHYKRMKVQPWAALDDWLTSDQKIGHYLGSAVAYLARFNSTSPGKGGLQDVEKAKHCLEKLIDTLKKEKKGG